MSDTPASGRTVVHVIASVSGSAGGPPLSSSRLAAARAARGHRVRFISENPDAPDAVTRSLPELEMHKVPRPKWTELFARGPARRRIAALLGGASVVYLHGVWDPLLLATAAEARTSNVPYVVVPVGMLDPWSLAQKKWKKQVALALGVRATLDRAAAIRALNRDEADLIRPLGLKAPVRVIPNGVNLSEIDTPIPEDTFARTVPAVAGRPFVLFLSRLHYKKGLDVLADAFAQLVPTHPDVQLVVAGPDGGDRVAFERRIADHGLSARVHLPGPLYGPAKWATLREASCFCLPSHQEGFSLAVLEALASRVPVVVSEGCHFPEVGETNVGVVTTLDPANVGDGLNRLLADPSAARVMGAAGRRLIEERYTWDKVAEQCDRLDADIATGQV